MLLGFASAIGIEDLGQERQIIFEPNKKFEFDFNLLGETNLEADLNGDISKFATIIDESGKTGARPVKLVLELPSHMEEGIHKMTIGVRQAKAEQGSISVRAGVRLPIYVTVLNSEPFIMSDLSVTDANSDENLTIKLSIKSWTYADISSINAHVRIFDLNDELIKDDIELKYGQLNSQEQISLVESLKADFLDVGLYKANATINYDSQVAYTTDEQFRIGSLELSITNHTKTFFADEINKFTLTIESNWNHPIDNVYARISVQDEIIQTPTLERLPAFEDANLTGHWQPKANETGEYTAVVNIVFNEGETITKHINVQVIEKENPSPSFWNGQGINSLTIILIAVIVLIVIIDLLWIMKKNRK